MDFVVEPITGRAVARLGGRERSLVCDMRAAQFLYEARGEFWTYWIADKCYGQQIDIGAGQRVRVVAALPEDDLWLLLYALLASDRANTGAPESLEVLTKQCSGESREEVQRLITQVVTPCFGIPGKGLAKKQRRSRVKKKQDAWDWRRVLEIGLGLLDLAPEQFWATSLVEWNMRMSGFAEKDHQVMRKAAWMVMHTLIAAGMKPDQVSVGLLLGESRARKEAAAASRGGPNHQSDLKEIMEECTRLCELRKKRVEELGEEVVKAEEAAALQRARDLARRKYEREQGIRPRWRKSR